MADFVATIKVNIEAATGGGTGAGTGGAAASGAGPVDLTGPIVKTIQQLQEEFRNLSAQVRSVASSLEQIRNVQGASSNTGAPSDVSGVDQSLVEILKALLETGTAAKTAADATKEQTAATDEATKATKASADAKSEEADMHAKAAREAAAHARASEEATAADRARAKALKEIQGGAPERAPAKFGGSGAGRLSDVRIFEDIIKGIGSNPGLKELAAQTSKDLADLVQIPKGAGAQVKREGEELKKSIGSIISTALAAIKSGTATASTVSSARRAIASQVRDTRERLPQGAQAPTADPAAIARGIAAKALDFEINRANQKIAELGKALEEGADSIRVAGLKQAADELLASVVRITRGVSGQLFGTDRRTGREAVTGGADILRSLRGEGIARAPSEPTDPRQLKAFETLRESLNNAVTPLETIRKVVRDLVDNGRGLGDLRQNLLGFVDGIKNLDESDFPSRQVFLNFQESLKALKKVSVGQQGQITGPAGAVDRDSAILAGQRAVQQARANLAARAQTAGPGQRGGIKDSIDLQLPTASGGIKKVRVELEALGTTVDSVRVKAKDLSANMFDRTSVRAALQRVAVWSTAAGLVFGAFTAFRQGINVLIDTESALVGLAKVMNESAADLGAFKSEAQAAAVAIANDFGQPLEKVLETMILFGQQGKNLRETIALSKAAALAASVTTLDQPEAASALTAATQQFGLAFSEAESIVDKFNEVANNAAVTETDLAQALKKSGQAAKNAGLDLDQFNGVVAAIAEQTRQSGNEIGTALRFIFSRLQTPEAEKGLAQVGISARDASGNLRAFTPIIEELAGKFDNLSNSQKTQVAISIAGTRRFNTLLALLDNFSRVQDATANSANSAGSALREQQKVTETAAFKIEQLKNSLKELALSFGDSLIGPLKLVVTTLGSMVGILSKIPGPVKTLGAGIGISSLAFLKFSEQITNFLGLAGSIKGASGVIGGSLRTNITQGLSREAQISKFGDEVIAGTTLGVTAARAAPDINLSGVFGKNKQAVSAFSKELKLSNLQLLDQQGNVVKSSAAFGKFGATIRGFSVQSTEGLGTSALALSGLNSGLVKFAGFLGIAAGKIATVIPGMGKLFAALDARAAATNSTSLALLGTFARFAVAGGIITGLVIGFSALKDAAFESAEEVERGLASEIQKRKEAVAILSKESQEIKSLTDARRRAASVSSPDPFQSLSAPQEQDVLSGGFKSAVVAIQRIRVQEQEAANQIGFANPELISGIDEFGNVVLNSASAFDSLADSAGNAQEVLLAFSQVKVIAAFADELKESTGLMSEFVNGLDDALGSISLGGIIPDKAFTTTKDRFNELLRDFKEVLNDPVIKQARELGVPVSSLSPAKAEKLGKAGQKFQRGSLDVRRVIEGAQERIRSLPEDSGEIIFEALAKDAKRVFDSQVKLLSTQGIKTDTRALINQARLQNLSALKAVREEIAATPALTIGKLRESGKPLEVVDIDAARKNITGLQKELERFTGGELILFKDVEGIPRQAVVEVTATGKRQISFIADEFGTFATQELSDVFGSAIGEVQFVDPDKIKRQLTSALQEIDRIITGAGRGGLLSKELDLGVNFRSDISAQQRAAQGNELLFTDLQAAQEQLAAFRESFGAAAETGHEPTATKITDPENVAAVQKMARAIDELATAAKLSVVIEDVAIAFEKAADKIKNSRIEEAVSAEFSGALGATTDALKRSFQTPVLRQNIDAIGASDRQSQGVVELGNTLSRVQQANGDIISGLQIASRNISTFVRDFENAGVAGAVRDPNRLSDLARRSAALSNTGLDRAQAILTTINTEQLSAQEKTNEILNHINANLSKEPRLIGAALAQSVLSAKGDEGDITAIASAIEAQADKISGFTPQDLQTILSNVPAQLIPAVVRQFRESQAVGAAGGLTTSLVGIGGGQERNRLAGLEGIELLEELARKGVFGKETQQLAIAGQGVPEEVVKATASALQTAISTAFTDAQFEKILSKKDATSTVDVSPAKVEEVLQVAIKALEDSGNKNARQAAEEIKSALAEGGSRQTSILDSVKNAILQTVNVGTPVAPPTVEVAKSLQQTKEEADRLTAAMEATVRANDAVLKPLRDATGAFFAFKDALISVTTGLKGAVQQAVDDISIGRSTSQFTTPQIGLLAGISLPATASDQRRRTSDLSGGELTALESPQLASGLNEVNTAFNTLVGQLTKIRQEQLNTQRALEGFQAEGNVRGIGLAKEALSQLGSISTLVEGQINNAQGTLKKFGEAFRNVEAVNQLRVDVEKLVESFDREITLKFDRTSISTALGGTLFSAIRPTFEQFEQGQAGFLTKFERSLASIDFQERAGTITPQAATRGRAEVEFNKAEDIIALAQSKENEKLQAAIGSAEQVRSRLFDFVQTGAPGSEAAQALLDQITTELEQAGDIIPGGFASTIRDPRTGREVDVPASAVNTFKGLPGLSTITQQLTQLSQEATKSNAQDNADLITQPLLLVLDKIPTKLDEIVTELKSAGGLTDPEQATNLAIGTTEITKELSRILSPLQRGGPLTAAEVAGVVEALTNISTTLSPDTLANLLPTAIIAPGGKGTEQSFETLLRKTLPERLAGSRPDDIGNVSAAINSVFETANKSITARFDLLEAPILGVVAAGTAAAEGMTLLSGATALVTTGLSQASEALARFTASLQGPDFIGIFKQVGEEIKLLFSNNTKSLSSADPFGPNIQKRAQGGLITGPGGPTEDKVPVLASPGEFVINAKSASKIGIDRLNALNGASGSIGPDSRAVGASLAFQGGGLVDPTEAYAQQLKELAENKKKALEEEASVLGARKLRAKLEQLEASKTVLYSGENAGSDAAKRNQQEIDTVKKQLAIVKEKAAEDQEKQAAARKRLEELRAQGITQVDGKVSIPDEALGKTAKERLLEERSRRSKAAERENTFQPIEPGKNFARLSPEGDRIVYDNDASAGGTDVTNLLGVSTRDPKEFAAEVARRKKALLDIENADKLRQAKKEELTRDFLAGQAAKEEPTPSEEQDAFSQAYVRLQDVLRDRTGTAVDKVVKTFNSANNGIGTAQEVSTTRFKQYTTSEIDQFAQSLNSNISDVSEVNNLLLAAKKQQIAVSKPPTYENIPDPNLAVRSEFSPPAAGISTLGGGFKPFANGFIFNDNPQTQGLVEQYTQAQLLTRLKDAQAGLLEANKTSSQTKRFVGEVGEVAGTAVLDAAEFYQGKTDSELVKDLIGGTAGQLKGLTDLGTQTTQFFAGAAGGIVGGEFDATKLADLRPVDLLKGSVALSEGVIGVGEHLYSNTIGVVGENASLYEQLNNTQDPEERKRIRRELINAQGKLFGAAVEVGTVIQPLSSLKGKVPPITPKGRRLALAKKEALTHTSSATALEAAQEAKFLAADATGAGLKAAERTAAAKVEAFTERANALKVKEQLQANALRAEEQAAIAQRYIAASRAQSAAAKEASLGRASLSVEDQVTASLGKGNGFIPRHVQFAREGFSEFASITSSAVKSRAEKFFERRKSLSPAKKADDFFTGPEVEARLAERAPTKGKKKKTGAPPSSRPTRAQAIKPPLISRSAKFLGRAALGSGGVAGAGALVQALGLASPAAGLGLIGSGLAIGGGFLAGTVAVPKAFRFLKNRLSGAVEGPTLADRFLSKFSKTAPGAERGFATGLKEAGTPPDLGLNFDKLEAELLGSKRVENILSEGKPTIESRFAGPEALRASDVLANIPQRLGSAEDLQSAIAHAIDPRFSGPGAVPVGDLAKSRAAREAAAVSPRLTPGGGPRADLVKLAEEGAPDALDRFIEQARLQEKVANEIKAAKRAAEESAVPRPIEDVTATAREQGKQLALNEGFTLDKRGVLRAPKGGLELETGSGRPTKIKAGAIAEDKAIELARKAVEERVKVGGLFEETQAAARQAEKAPPVREFTRSPQELIDENNRLRGLEVSAFDAQIPGTLIGKEIPKTIAGAEIPGTLVGKADETLRIVKGGKARARGKGRAPAERPFDLGRFTAELEKRAPRLGTPIKDPRRLGPSPVADPRIGPTGLASEEAILSNLQKAKPGDLTIAQRQAAEARRIAAETRAVTAQIRVPKVETNLDKLLRAFGKKSGAQEGLTGAIGAGVSLLPDVGRFVKGTIGDLFGRRKGKGLPSPDIGADILADINKTALSPLEKSGLLPQGNRLPFSRERSRRQRQQQLDAEINELAERDVFNPISVEPGNITAVLEREAAASSSVLRQSRPASILEGVDARTLIEAASEGPGGGTGVGTFTGRRRPPRRIDEETLPGSALDAPAILKDLKQEVSGRVEADALAAFRERGELIRAQETARARPAGIETEVTTPETLAVNTASDLRALRIAASNVESPRAILELNAELARAEAVASRQGVKGGGLEVAPLDPVVSELLPTFITEKIVDPSVIAAQGAEQSARARGLFIGNVPGQGAKRIQLSSKNLLRDAEKDLIELAEQTQLTTQHELSHFFGEDQPFLGGAVTDVLGSDVNFPRGDIFPDAATRTPVKGIGPTTAADADAIKEALIGAKAEDVQFLGTNQSLANAFVSRQTREASQVLKGRGNRLDADLLTHENLKTLNADTARRFRQFQKDGTGMSPIEAKAYVQTLIEPRSYQLAKTGELGYEQGVFQNLAYDEFGLPLDKGTTSSQIKDLAKELKIEVPELNFPTELPNVHRSGTGGPQGSQAALQSSSFEIPSQALVPVPPTGLGATLKSGARRLKDFFGGGRRTPARPPQSPAIQAAELQKRLAISRNTGTDFADSSLAGGPYRGSGVTGESLSPASVRRAEDIDAVFSAKKQLSKADKDVRFKRLALDLNLETGLKETGLILPDGSAQTYAAREASSVAEYDVKLAAFRKDPRAFNNLEPLRPYAPIRDARQSLEAAEAHRELVAAKSAEAATKSSLDTFNTRVADLATGVPDEFQNNIPIDFNNLPGIQELRARAFKSEIITKGSARGLEKVTALPGPDARIARLDLKSRIEQAKEITARAFDAGNGGVQGLSSKSNDLGATSLLLRIDDVESGILTKSELKLKKQYEKGAKKLKQLEGREQKLLKFAQGGKIQGPGGPTSDRIPVLTSPGEFILNANAVGQIGLPVIESMNRTGILPKFQHGGAVSDEELLSAGNQLKTRDQVYSSGFGRSLTSILTPGPRLKPGVELPQSGGRLTSEQALIEQRSANARLSEQVSTGLVSQRAANDKLSTQTVAGLIKQREENARFSAATDKALLEAQGRTSFSTALPGSTGRNASLQNQADLLELDNSRRLNSGGPLSGPGGPNSDSIPILASNGEYIVNAAAAGKLGLSTLEQLNATGKLPGFAEGGDVSGRSSGGSISVNTEEIAAAIRDAIVQGASEASISIDTESAATSISSAVASALSNIQFPDVKLDASSIGSSGLGNSVGADIISTVKLLEGSVEHVKESTNNILADISELNLLKDSFSRQEEDILNKVEFRLSKESSITSSSAGGTDLTKDIAIIKAEMVRIERELKQTTSQASLALSKAQAK